MSTYTVKKIFPKYEAKVNICWLFGVLFWKFQAYCIWLKNHAFQHYMLECSKSIFFTVYHTCPGQYFLMQHTYRKINLSFPLMSLNENEGFRAVNTLSIFYLHEIEQLVRNRLDNFLEIIWFFNGAVTRNGARIADSHHLRVNPGFQT